jgi:deoxycytidine triphosphate deaminase
MSRILSDREIRKLLGSVIQGADEKLLNPNGIELRLGHRIKFISTGEEKNVPEGHYVRLAPGESAIIGSLERLDFSKATVHEHFKNCMLMALITPTTTMMREGITQAATKVDAGFVGNLNWGFRNSSFKDFKIQSGEPIFKLTLFLLEGHEVPEVCYGEKTDHKYQNTDGILSSARRVLADIPDEKIVSSSFEKLDPKKQLREAGHPFTYISTELTKLDGKFEVVSSGVQALTAKIDETKDSLLDKVDSIFQKKFLWSVTLFAGLISFLYGALGFLQQKTTLTTGGIHIVAACFGIILPLAGWFLFFNRNKKDK